MRCSISSTVPIELTEASELLRLLEPDRRDMDTEDRDDDVDVDERRGFKASSHELVCFLGHIAKE